MRKFIAIVCVIAAACTPTQVHTVNQARIANGQRPLGEVEAVQLYCSHWPRQRLAYLHSIGLDPTQLGPAPRCGVAPTAPKPAPPPPPAAPAGPYTDVIAAVWPPGMHGVIACIQFRESRNIPTAVGGAGERGLMQIHPNHFISGGWGFPGPSAMAGSGLTWDQMFDPLANHRAARWLHDRAGGLNGWTTAAACR
ncbi:MAG: lytic transglycosylase domain-containing protein [Acidimicrobiia bacterium]|nr:lytic transglycosylase domain-containing protein [Acidimicrobiia bacterium]